MTGRPSNLTRWHEAQREQRRQAEAPIMALVETLRAQGLTWSECVKAVNDAGHLTPLGVPFSFPALTQAVYRSRKRQAA